MLAALYCKCSQVEGSGLKKKVNVYGTLKLEKRASFKPDLRFVDVAYRLVPIQKR